MNLSSLFFGIVMVLVLLGVAGYFGWQQIRNSQTLRHDSAMLPQERNFLRRQIRRRLICSVLMVVLAGLLVGWFVIASRLPEHLPSHPDEKASDNPWVVMIVYYLTFALLVLFAILILAGIDLIATARFGLRSQRLLESERRAVLEAEAARFRKKRHEQNGA
jgi:heme A synthase